MPTEDDYDDEYEDDDEDEIGDPSDFFNLFADPNKLFNSKQFRSLFKKIFEKITKEFPDFQKLSPEDIQKELMKNKDKFGFPFMYGFNINIGPDGKPRIDSFGNIKAKPYSRKPKVQVDKSREPLIEIIEESDKLVVIAEMPGVMKDDVELKATSRSLTISTKINSFGRKYYKEIELPAAINSDYAKARLQNGILEVKLKKIDEKHTNIKID
ncbi:MAG: archaeal heat shock protein Hsp20 [Promethearchaeota archaeon]